MVVGRKTWEIRLVGYGNKWAVGLTNGRKLPPKTGETSEVETPVTLTRKWEVDSHKWWNGAPPKKKTRGLVWLAPCHTSVLFGCEREENVSLFKTICLVELVLM